ncbi:phage tail sheath subtilisin-like domain-containing protein [Burkholderia gladioli]|uniref:phage tail sheath subtilisin-like domain-containing protein n=1 Tax=Burkholderia gladioli TaxID=28095 RepID=UPI0016412684|nr:phage tail sheath subtilisin-like domain-containing protein [Burkholderia gladioli]
MSTIPFQVIPSNLRLPGAYFELDNSQANTGATTQRALVIGQITAVGTATPNVPLICGGIGDAQAAGGANSMLANMIAAYRLNDTIGEVWMLPIADAAGATAAAGEITITASPSANGTLSLYVAGNLVTVPVTAGQAVGDVASAIVAAVNAIAGIPVTAASQAGVVTLTAVNKGLCGNEIDIRFNYRGTAGGEVTPAGLTYTITAMTGGATNPSLTTALANLGPKTFDFIVNPYTDAASLDAVKALLNDQTGRWSYLEQLYGHSFGAFAGTYGQATTLGESRNNQHESILAFDGSPTPSWLWASALAGQVAVSVRADPGKPLQYLPLNGVLAPQIEDQWASSIRLALLWGGISTFKVQDDGTVQTENIITTYQKNAQGVPDDSYLEVETMYQLVLEIRTLQAMLTSKYARSKLADDGSRPAAGSNLVTPSTIKSDIIALYNERADAGFVQGTAAFAAALVVQKNTTNPNRVDILWPGTPVNQMRTFATLVQFRLQ